MKITPKYQVIYHGVLRPAGVPFEIEEKDEAELAKHGVVEKTEETEKVSPVRTARAKKTKD